MSRSMSCDRGSSYVDWYYCWHSGIVIIHTPDYESLQNQKDKDVVRN